MDIAKSYPLIVCAIANFCFWIFCITNRNKTILLLYNHQEGWKVPLHFYYDISKPVGTLLIRILLYKLCGQDYSCDGVPIIAWMCHPRLYT